tara:strand:+ start:1576 stop:2532 length:957 start_codon:yes stop_codon:yes gene_type:complete
MLDARRLSVGDSVEIHGLSSRTDLNGTVGTLLRFHSEADRWQVQVRETGEAVRVRPANVRCDRIEVLVGGDVRSFLMRPDWAAPLDADESAYFVLVGYVLAEKTNAFCGVIWIHSDGQPPREFKPSQITVLPPTNSVWDATELMDAIKTALPTRRDDVREAPVRWNAASERDCHLSMEATILSAHSDSPSPIYVAARTATNLARFALFQVLCERSPPAAGTIVCAPTEVIVFHGDDFIKIPGSFTLTQATRKISDMVTTGIQTACPVCLEAPSASDHTVFMPCPCSVAIHLSCLQRLMDEEIRRCPICRAPLVAPRAH